MIFPRDLGIFLNQAVHLSCPATKSIAVLFRRDIAKLGAHASSARSGTDVLAETVGVLSIDRYLRADNP